MTPTTLPALRAAVARVLVARGESAEAVTVVSVPLRSKRRAVTLTPTNPGWHPFDLRATGATPADAVAAAWALVCERCGTELAAAAAGYAAAEARLRRARAACEATCEAAGVGDG